MIKFKNNAYLLLYGPVSFPSSGTKPVFTSRNDDVFGERIAGVPNEPDSDGNPALHRAAQAIWIYYVNFNTTIQNVDVRWTQRAIQYDVNPGVYVTHTLQSSSLRRADVGVYANLQNATLVLNSVKKCSVVTPISCPGYPYYPCSTIYGTLTEDCEGDTDSDGLPDSWEIQYFGNLSQPANGNPDGDGLTNYEEWLYGTNPTLQDSDSDGIPDGTVTVTNIKFNYHTGSSDYDGINIRQNYDTALNLANGEWVKDSLNQPACYRANRSVRIQARITIEGPLVSSATISATSLDADGSLGNVNSTTVNFVNGVSSPKYVTFYVAGSTPNCIKKTTSDVWQWKIANVNDSGCSARNANQSGPHTVYTILSEPAAPWNNTWGSQQNAWASALAIVCSGAPWAGGCTSIIEAAEKATKQIYNCGRFTYDFASGGDVTYTRFNQNGVDYFDLTAWLERLAGGGGRGPTVNCWDCANGVVSLANVLGCDLWNQWMGWTFECNEIRAIKDNPWAKPFGWGFSYHRVGWRGEVVDSGHVFDACLKVDNDGNPTGMGNHNSELIPTDLIFWTVGGDFDDYKGLLVAPPSYSSCNVSDSPGGIFNPGRRRDPIR